MKNPIQSSGKLINRMRIILYKISLKTREKGGFKNIN